MSCCSFLGRLLLAVIFIGAGYEKLTAPQNSAGFLNARYPGFFQHLDTTAKQFNVPLPAQLYPTTIKQISTQLIYGVGAAEVVLALFVILNQGWAGKLLSLLTLSFVAIIHNPLLHGTTQEEKLQELIQGLWTFGIAGALLIVGTSSVKVNAPAPEATKTKGVAPAAPTKKAKRN